MELEKPLLILICYTRVPATVVIDNDYSRSAISLQKQMESNHPHFKVLFFSIRFLVSPISAIELWILQIIAIWCFCLNVFAKTVTILISNWICLQLILGSSSIARRKILTNMGYQFTLMVISSLVYTLLLFLWIIILKYKFYLIM